MIKAKALAIYTLFWGIVLLGLDVAGQLRALLEIRVMFAAGLTTVWGVEFIARLGQGLRNGFEAATQSSILSRLRSAVNHAKMYVLDRLAMYGVFALVLGGTLAAKNMFVGTSLESAGRIIHTLSIAVVFFWLLYDAGQWLKDLLSRQSGPTADVDFLSTFIAVGRALRTGDIETAADEVDETQPNRAAP
jgi:hypothetical protein